MSAAAQGATGRPLEYLPVGLFGAVLGLTALSVAWRLAHTRLDLPVWISEWTGAAAVLAFVLLAIGYAIKLVCAPAAVRAEFVHPVGGNLFGTILIALLLLPLLVAPTHLLLARVLWCTGALGMLVFAWVMFTRWLSARQEMVNVTPAWFVPVVGMLDVPLAFPAVDLPAVHGLALLGLAVGLLFALPLFTLVLFRLLFEAPLSAAQQPTLMILLAPFPIGSSAYIAMTDEIGVFAQLLCAAGLFLLVVLVGRLRHLVRCCPFRTAWWAVSFPLAASAVAALRLAGPDSGWPAKWLALAILIGATVVVGWLFARTVVGIARGELRTLSG